jgi:hypothetical protein
MHQAAGLVQPGLIPAMSPDGIAGPGQPDGGGNSGRKILHATMGIPQFRTLHDVLGHDSFLLVAIFY